MIRYHDRQDLKSGQTLHYTTYQHLPTVVYIYELTVEKLFIHLCSVHSIVLLQMRIGYDAIILREQTDVLHPVALYNAMDHHHDMIRVSCSRSS